MVREEILGIKKGYITLLCLFLLCTLLSLTLVYPHAWAQAADDYLEENNAGAQNDTHQNATLIEPGEYTGLVCNDDDWYRVSVPASGAMLRANLRASISFMHTQGDLELVLYDAQKPFNSSEYLNNSALTTNEEVVSASVPPGDYLVKVYGHQGATNSNYTLKVTILYACQSVPYEWIEMGDGGLAVSLANDASWVIQDIGFDFPFFGGSYDRVEISSNGYLTFATAATPSYNPISPTPISPTHKNAPPDCIFAYWMNLRPDLGGDVFYRVDDSYPDCRRLVIEWRDIPRDASGAGITFQAVLYECTGQVLLQYKDVTFLGAGDGASLGAGATVGINNGKTTASSPNRLGTQYLYREPLLADQTALLFSPSLDAPLQVLKSTPQENAVDVPPDQGIELVFSQHLDAVTVSGAVSLTPSITGTWTADRNILRFTHAGVSLDNGTPYEVAIDGTMLRDVFGNALADAADYTLSFQTAIGPGGEPNISVDPSPATPHNFDSVYVGEESGAFAITITNTGNDDLNIYSITLSDTNNFTLNTQTGTNPIGTPPVTIAPGGSRTLSVSFSPKSAGTKALTLTITSNDPDTQTVTFSFQGTGVPHVPNIQVTPSPPVTPHNFGSIYTNGSSTAYAITIENTGNDDLNIYSITLSDTNNFTLNTQTGTNPIGTPPVTIAPGGSRTLSVSFSPKSAGTKALTLTITSNDPDTQTVTFSFQGTGVPHVPNIQVTPSPPVTPHNFGSIYTNGSSTAYAITIENTGNDDLNIYSITLSDTNNFILNTQSGTNPIGTPPVTIAPNGSRTLSVSFSPQAAGTLSATLSIESNDPDSPAVTFSFKGIGLADVENWDTFGPDYCFGPDACLPSPIITALLLDNNGTLWIGTWPYTAGSQTAGGGVCAYNLYTGAFACFDENDGLFGDMVRDIAMGPLGEIWVAAEAGMSGEEGVSRYIGDGVFEAFGPDDMGLSSDASINDITVDIDSHLWVATTSGIFKYNGTDWINYSTSGEKIFEGEPNISFNDDTITGILAGPSGRLFIGTAGGGLFIKDPAGASSHFGSLTSGKHISNMALDPNGNLWYSADKGGKNTLMFLEQGGSPVTIPVPSELATSASGAIKALFIDPASGNVFIGSDIGFYRYDGQTWSMFDTSNSGLLTNEVNAILIDSFGDYWVGTLEGLSHFNPKAPSMAGEKVYGEGEKRSDLPVNTTISVRFSEPMDRSSAESSFEMIDLSNGNDLQGTFTWNESFTIMTFKPSTPLKYDTTYEIWIYNTAKDRWGRTIDLGIGTGADFRSFTIKTKAAPKPPISITPSYGLYPYSWPSYTYTFPSWTGFTQYGASYLGQTSYLNYMVQPSAYAFPSWTGFTQYGASYPGQTNYINFMSQPPTYWPSQYSMPFQSTWYSSAGYGIGGSSALPYSFGTGYQPYGFLPTYGSTAYGYRYR